MDCGGFWFEAQLAGTTQDHLQIFNIELKLKVKSHQNPEQVTVLCPPNSRNIRLWILILVLSFFTLVLNLCILAFYRLCFGSGFLLRCLPWSRRLLFIIGPLKASTLLLSQFLVYFEDSFFMFNYIFILPLTSYVVCAWNPLIASVLCRWFGACEDVRSNS